MSSQLTPAKAFPTGTIVPGSWFTDLQADVRSVARNFWDDSSPDLPLSEHVKGTTHADPVSKALRLFRQTTTGADGREKSSPLRPTWHHDDLDGEPPIDGRSVEGDLLVWDDGEGDRFLKVRGAEAWFGLAMLAQYRTAATDGEPAQHSDNATWRASSWAGLDAEDREFLARCFVRSSAELSDAWEWRLAWKAGATKRDVVRATNWGELKVQGPGGGQPGLLILSTDLDNVNSAGQSGAIGCTSTDGDGTSILFIHGQASKRLNFNLKNPTAGLEGLSALSLWLSPSSVPDEEEPFVASPTAALTASYLTESGATGATWWLQHLLDSADPTGRLRFANTYGDGVLDLHHYGRLALAGTTVLAGDVAAGNAGAFTSAPTYSGAHAVTTHALLEFNDPTLSGGATLGDAVLARYDANPGTHTGLDAAAGGADAWEKRETPAGLLYAPLLASKDLGIPAPVYGEMSLTDGSAAMTVSDGPDSWNPLAGFDAEGRAVGVDVDLVNGAITPDEGGAFTVSLSVSFTGAAAEYVFAVAEVIPGETPTFVQVGRQARVTTTSGEVASVAVECLLDVTTGSALVPLVKSPTGASVGLTLREAAFTVVKVDAWSPA